MGGPKSLKAYQVSERLTLDYISEYIKCCCTSTGYLISAVLQRGRTLLQQPGEVGRHLLHTTAVEALLYFCSTLLMLGVIKQSTQTRAICVQGHSLPLHLLNCSLSSLKVPSWVGYICPKRGRCSLCLSNSKGYHSPSTILKISSRFSGVFSEVVLVGEPVEEKSLN